MSKPSKRSRRVADLVHREVAKCIQSEVMDPRLTGLSITDVEMTPDMKAARIFYSLFDDAALADAAVALKKADRFIRHRLAKQSELRYTPKLIFKYDDTLRRAEHLSRLINDAQPLEQEDDNEKETP
jgi:ribosome-binding factor A